MGFTGAGISPTTVTTTQQAPLGFVLTAPSAVSNGGHCEWIYIHTEDALVAGEVVMKKDGDATYANLKTGAAGVLNIRIVGVAQHVIAAGSYGFVLRKGVGEVGAADTGADQANDPLIVAVGSSKGYGDVYDSGTAADLGGVFAISSENAAATIGALMTCTIDCRG